MVSAVSNPALTVECSSRLQIDAGYTNLQVAAVLLEPRFLPGFLFTDGPLSIRCSLSLMMLRAGMATVYEQTDAVYGDHVLARYKAAEEEAQWVQ